MADNDRQAREQSGDGSPRETEERAALAEPALERGVSRVMAEIVDPVIERTVARRQQAAVRQGLAEVMRDALNALAQEALQREALPATVGVATVGNGAIAAGIGAAQAVRDLGFVEFTTGLINGTFDAIIAATIRQMDAYAKLVADLAKTLAQFQAENVSDAQINAHLANRYPDGAGGTAVRSNFTFKNTEADPANGVSAKTGNAKLQEVVAALIAETANVQDATLRLTRDGQGGTLNLDIAEANTTIVQFTANHVRDIRKAMGAVLATSMLEHLRAMAREGMARIVITDGELLSKLTFNVSATAQQSKQAAKFHSDSLGVNLKATAGWGWGSASLGASYNQMNVSAVNESSFDSVTMSAEIIGQVRIKFRTETFPPITTSA
jgi:hypothetical protein